MPEKVTTKQVRQIERAVKRHKPSNCRVWEVRAIRTLLKFIRQGVAK